MAGSWAMVRYMGKICMHILDHLLVIGKAEGTGLEWHGHVTALTVAPEYRRLSLARKMMNLLEMVSEAIYKAFFVDLYVRCANSVAISMYEGMGYSIYRRVREYYGNLGVGKGGRDEEDAFGKFIDPQPLRVLTLILQICENLYPATHSVVQSGQTVAISSSVHTMYHDTIRTKLGLQKTCLVHNIPLLNLYSQRWWLLCQYWWRRRRKCRNFLVIKSLKFRLVQTETRHFCP